MKSQEILYLEKLSADARALMARLQGNSIKEIKAKVESKSLDQQMELQKNLEKITKQAKELETAIDDQRNALAEKKEVASEAAQDSWEQVQASLEKTWADIQNAWNDFAKKINEEEKASK